MAIGFQPSAVSEVAVSHQRSAVSNQQQEISENPNASLLKAESRMLIAILTDSRQP